MSAWLAPGRRLNVEFVIWPRAFAIESYSNDSPPLDYATPPRRPKSRVKAPVVAVLGAIASLFGAFMLFYGVDGIVWLVSDWNLIDGEDFFAVMMFNVIGGLSVYFSIRWIRSAIMAAAARSAGEHAAANLAAAPSGSSDELLEAQPAVDR